jgi:diadenylate cyclase
MVSLCHRGRIERDFDPESFRRRLGELLLLEKEPMTSRAGRKSLGGEASLAAPGDDALDGDAKERRSDNLAF